MVGRHKPTHPLHCAFCDKSTRFRTHVDTNILNRCGYRAIAGLASDGCGSHFTKWPPAVPVILHTCSSGEVCRFIVEVYSLMKVQRCLGKSKLFYLYRKQAVYLDYLV